MIKRSKNMRTKDSLIVLKKVSVKMKKCLTEWSLEVNNGVVVLEHIDLINI